MRRTNPTLITVLLSAATLGASAAPAAAAPARDVDDAGDVRATVNVRLRARPGETARVVSRGARGEVFEVVARWGRWVRVRHGKRIGWVPRTELEADRTREQPRKREGRSGFSGKAVDDALTVTVAIDRVRGFDDPVTKATCVLDLARGETVTALGRGHDGWLLIEKKGVLGWIPATAVSDGGAVARAVVITGGTDEAPAKTGARVPTGAATAAPGGRVAADVLATAGGQTFAMRQDGTGAALATASGPAAQIAGAARMRVTGNLWIGGGADAAMNSASMIYAAGGEQSNAMATRGMAVDARATVGWGRRWLVEARAGYHYASLDIESDRGEAMLVGDRTAGLLAGVGGAVPIGRRLALAVALDFMPAGAQRPAELTDGIMYPTSVRAAWARSTVTYRLPAHVTFALAYLGGLATAELTDGAETPTTATRTDQSHTVTAGLGLRW